jgi:hypothetical protein
VSTWHDKEALNPAAVDSLEYRENAHHSAHQDIVEITTAQVFVILTTDCELTPGGLWFEMGYAYSAALQVVVLGPHINIFCFLQYGVEQVDTDEACPEAVARHERDLAECDKALEAVSLPPRLQAGDAFMGAAL